MTPSSPRTTFTYSGESFGSPRKGTRPSSYLASPSIRLCLFSILSIFLIGTIVILRRYDSTSSSHNYSTKLKQEWQSQYEWSPRPHKKYGSTINVKNKKSSLQKLDAPSVKIKMSFQQQATSTIQRYSTHDDATAICEEGIDSLTDAIITSGIDKFGLRPINFSVGDKEFYFGGLDLHLIQRVLIDNEIAILGDSTLRNLFTYIWFLLKMTAESHSLLSKGQLANMDLYNATNVIRELGSNISGLDFGINMKDSRGNSFLEFDSFNHFPPEDAVGYAYTLGVNGAYSGLQYLTKYNPKVVIANVGLHLLHIQNYDHDKGYKEVETWLNYEKILEQFVVASESAGAELLILKTNNYICDEKYIGKFARGVSLYSTKNRRVINQCVASIMQKEQKYKSSSGITITVQDIQDYCTNAVLSEKGSSGLNERLYQFVNARRKQQQQQQRNSSSSSIKVAIFNDHKLQSCETTTIGDARHHHILTLARIRLLANLFDCMHD